MLKLILLSIFVSLPLMAHASVSLTVMPTHGGNQLRLEVPVTGIKNREDVHVRVNNAESTRYQVFQRLLEPLVNEKGQTLDLNAIEFTTISNSNAAGTLYLQQPERMSMGDQLVYSSGNGGESDGFYIAYSLTPSIESISGNFSGRVLYEVRSLDGQTQQTVLNIGVSLKGKLSVEVQGSKNKERIVINDKDLVEKSAEYVKVSFSGNDNRDVKISQEVVMMPQSNEVGMLDNQDIMFYAASNANDIKATAPQALSTRRHVIYQGSEESANIEVYYLLNAQKLATIKPGHYTGSIKLIIEQGDELIERTIALECDVQSVFLMDIQMPGGGIAFDRVLPNTPAQEKEVTIEVRSNLQKPYQVNQMLASLLTNEKGAQLDKNFFTLKIEIPQGQKGSTEFNEFKAVESMEVPIFTSDNKGTPAIFKVIYKLQGYVGMNAGQFNAPLRFSLNQN